jgi:uncharacterized damage-inducible protein DinB
MDKNKHAEFLLQELETEYLPTKKCIERISEKQYDYKPHPKAMPMGYLTALVSEIPMWISSIARLGEIDLATYPHADIKTTDEMVYHLEANYKSAREALQQLSDEDLQKTFSLKVSGKTVARGSRLEHIASSLNHWVHHRGQLSVYMRMNEIKVPSIYGPSGDENPFT